MMQFSLRSLLLAMALVGVGLVIYRWPWVEEGNPKDPFRDLFTTYRRGWNGKALRHGLCKTSDSYEAFYIDDEKVWEASYQDGRLESKHFYRAGKLHGRAILEGGRTQITYVADRMHGPYSAYDGALTGQYSEGEQDGEWRAVYDEQGQQVSRVCSYHRGTPSGLWTWTSAGKERQSGRYEDGRLVEWNGRPLRIALRAWLEEQQFPAETIADLERPLGDFEFDNTIELIGQVYEIPIRNSPRKLLLNGNYFWWRRLSAESLASELSIGEAFIEESFRQSRALSNYYGIVSHGPIVPVDYEESDASGASRIHFPSGSGEDLAWREAIPEETFVTPSFDVYERLTNLFAGTPIQLDLDRLPADKTFLTTIWFPTGGKSPLPRRMWLELMLQREKLRCELQDGKLVVIPLKPPAKEAAE